MKGLCEKWSLDIVMKDNDDDLLTMYIYECNMQEHFEESSRNLIRIMYDQAKHETFWCYYFLSTTIQKLVV